MSSDKAVHEDKGRIKWNTTRAIIIVVVLLLGTAGFWIGIRFTLGTQNPLFVVTSGSMIPSLNINDVVVITNGNTFASIEVGDIIIYYRPGTPNECVIEIKNCIVHRVHGINVEDGDRMLVTKGDSNKFSDPWRVREENFIGKVIFTIPQLGVITRLIEPLTTPPINYALIAGIIVLIFLTELRAPRKRDRTEKAEFENLSII